MSNGHRSVGNHAEANWLATAGNMAKIVADRLMAGREDAAQGVFAPWLDTGSCQ